MEKARKLFVKRVVELSLDEIISTVVNNTREWCVLNRYEYEGIVLAEPETLLVSDRAKAISTILNDEENKYSHGFDNDEIGALAAIFGVILDEEIPISTSDDETLRVQYLPSVMVVPLTRTNDHNYPLGKPCLCVKGNCAMRLDGSFGNNLDSNRREGIRPATPDEIRRFFEELPPGSAKALCI